MSLLISPLFSTCVWVTEITCGLIISNLLPLKDFIIISYKEFINNYDKYKLDYKVCLSQQDINAILDDKYGKDNWVIKWWKRKKQLWE